MIHPGVGALSENGGAAGALPPSIVAPATLPIRIEVVPAAVLSGAETAADGGGDAAVWGVFILVDEVDVTDDVIGEVVIEAEEGAARVADFTLRPDPGSLVEIPEWTGRPVRILFADMRTGSPASLMPLFSGVVELPRIDLSTRSIALSCTDDLQGRVAAMTAAQVASLLGGRWSPAVFSASASAWVHAQDRLSTLAASLDVSPAGMLRVTPWAAKTTADLSFDADSVLDGSVSVDLANRSALVNQVDVVFGYRFPRMKSEGYEVNYDYLALHATDFGYWVRDGGYFLQRAAVLAAVGQAGGTVLAETWIPLPTTPQVIPGSGGAPAGVWLPNPVTDPTLCLGFSLVVGFDYGQDIEENYLIKVWNEASVAAVGVVRESMSGALEGQYVDPVAAETNVLLYKKDITQIPPYDLAPVVVGLTNSVTSTLTTASDRLAAEAAMEVLIDVAKTRIAAAHRATSVSASIPLNPVLDVDKTVAIAADGVVAKGKLRRLVHRLEPASGRATSEFSMAVCSVAGVGIEHPEDVTVAPAGTGAGTTSTLAAPTVTWNGLAGGDNVITIAFPGVAEAERDKADTAIERSYLAPLVEDVFTVTL